MTGGERPRTAVFAYSEPGCACLEELFREDANVVAVFTHEDDPNENIWFRSVREIALARGVPVRTDAKLGPEAVCYLRSLDVELIFSAYYRAMIPKEILGIPRLGAYNLHGALLPRYRGRACINWAVLNGETETGVTLHVMTEQADRGDIVAQKAVPIGLDDTALDVFLEVSEAAHAVLAESLADIEAGTAKRTPQDESKATTFGRRRPEDGLIDWTRTPKQLRDQIRALAPPFPGAFTFIDAQKILLSPTRAVGPGAVAASRDGAEASPPLPPLGNGARLIAWAGETPLFLAPGPSAPGTPVGWLGETPLFLTDGKGIELTTIPPPRTTPGATAPAAAHTALFPTNGRGDKVADSPREAVTDPGPTALGGG